MILIIDLMKKRSRFRYYVVAAVLISLVVGVCLDMFEPGTVGDVIPFIVSMISLLVAVLAFDISLKTYTSIDAVNSMTRMDGNIMENENYRTNLIALMKNLPQEDMKQSRNAMMRKLTDFFSLTKIVSGAKLADSIQQLIDYMIFFPYYVNASDEAFAQKSRESVNKLFSLIDGYVREFDKMSEGSSVLLNENLKLIKAVFDVQLKRVGCSTSETVNILEVRGTMMKNPVSRVLYHDYAGLFYLAKALDVMCGAMKCQSRSEMYDISRIKDMKSIPDNEKCRISEYLGQSEKEFYNALDVIGEDIMWRGMIYFNIARAKFFNIAMNEDKSDDWVVAMNEAVISRNKFNTYLSDVLPEHKNACLVRAFQDEEVYARLTKIVFEMALGRPLTDEYGDELSRAGEYASVRDLPVISAFEENKRDEFRLLSEPYGQIVANIAE